ncbi:MAG: polyhydroxyalkanoic acid system family protein [Ignavibacteriae bacterium]|nr:polyhydroxyalkanoic acid system family protein [Ignavibacteriota bacterium]
MPKIEIQIPHVLTQSEALTRVQKCLPELAAQNTDRISQVVETWSGNTGTFQFNASGFLITGSVDVCESFVLIKGNLPLMALPFKGQIESTIKQKAEALLGGK